MENVSGVSVLEWNINQRGGRGKGDIPPWIADEINGFDVAVLTEFCTKCEGRSAFIAKLEQSGYRCAISENSRGNDILIAVKSSFSISKIVWEPCYGEDMIPENLRVDIECGDRTLTIMGIRIKSLDGKKSLDAINRLRQKEFLWTLNRLNDIKNPVLITGDFNNNKRGSPYTIWSMSIMESMLSAQGFDLYTPVGSSMYDEISIFPYDHFAAKGATVSALSYNRDFTKRDPVAYFLGRDFRESWYSFDFC